MTVLDAFLATAALIFILEIGDKTQLALLALSASTRKPGQVLAGTMLAYVVIGSIAVFLGKLLGDFVSHEAISVFSAATFIILGLWSLKTSGDKPSKQKIANPFLFSFAVVFFSEIGDKTQIAASALAAKYDTFWPVFLGYLAGEFVIESLTVFSGAELAKRIPISIVKKAAALFFIMFGILALVT